MPMCLGSGIASLHGVVLRRRNNKCCPSGATVETKKAKAQSSGVFHHSGLFWNICSVLQPTCVLIVRLELINSVGVGSRE